MTRLAILAALVSLTVACGATPAPIAEPPVGDAEDPGDTDVSTVPDEPTVAECAASHTCVERMIGQMNSTCYVMESGELWCTGENHSGALHTQEKHSDVHVISDRVSTDVVDVHLGSSHACALAADGVVSCWGSMLFGRLGNGCTLDTNADVVCDGEIVARGDIDLERAHVLSGLPPVRALAGTADSVCALTVSDEVWCWGWNVHGAVGVGGASSILVPTKLTIPPVAELVGGAGHMCAVTTEERRVWCWGVHMIADPPDPLMRDLTTPTQMVRVPPLGVDAELIATRHGVCVLRGTEAHCWGDLTIGDGGPVVRSTPLLMDGVVALDGGSDFTCVVTTDGRVLCYTHAPPLAGVPKESPFEGGWHEVVMPFGAPVADLHATIVAICARSVHGDVACWGHWTDAQGILPDEGDPQSFAPTRPPWERFAPNAGE